MKKLNFFGAATIVIIFCILSYIGISITNNKELSTGEDHKHLSANDAVWVRVTDSRIPIKALWYPSFGLDSSYDIDDSPETNFYGDEYIAIFEYSTQYEGSEEFGTHVGEMMVYFSENKKNLSVQELLSSRYKSDYERSLWEQADAYEYVEYSSGIKGYMAKLGPLPTELQEYLDSEGFAPWVSGFEGISPDGSKIISVIMDNSGEGSIREVTPESEDLNYFLHATLERMEF